MRPELRIRKSVSGALVPESRAALGVLAAATLWGTAGTAQALGGGFASPQAIGAARLVIGGVALMVVASLSRGGPASMRSCFSRSSGPWMLGAGMDTALYQAAFFTSVARTAWLWAPS